MDLKKTTAHLVSEYTELWWACPGNLPEFTTAFTPQQHSQNESRLSRWIDELSYALDHIPQAEEERRTWQEGVREGLYAFVLTTFPVEQRHLNFMEQSGITDVLQAFVHMAREFDPALTGEDIYQAGRNVMTANFIQLLLGRKVEVTPSIFAYSLLYPYTDNYLDDPAISQSTKHSFNQRFQQMLAGKTVALENSLEETIGRLVEMIESQWDRHANPLVYESLQIIHAAQAGSLGLIQPGAAPYEIDVLGISFKKGGTSVLADGYLVAGDLTPEQVKYLFGYGTFTQLLDDLEDVNIDAAAGRATIFSQASQHWALDNLTNRLANYGSVILGDLNAFTSDAAAILSEIMNRSIDPILIDIIGRVSSHYTKDYLKKIEPFSPYRFRVLRKLRKKLDRRKMNFDKLASVLLQHVSSDQTIKKVSSK